MFRQEPGVDRHARQNELDRIDQYGWQSARVGSTMVDIPEIL